MRRVAILAACSCFLLLGTSPAREAASDSIQVYIDLAGAPGDGERALANALSERLLAKGLALSGTPAANVYEIQGIVRLSPAAKGKENVRIDWTIFDPYGSQLGIVTQTNVVRKGSLDRTWGAAADAVADAAAEDILKLLPH
jgi:hypothetical protein